MKGADKMDYKESLKEQMKDMTTAEALDFLDNREFMIEMKDHLSSRDYDMLSVISKLKKEISNGAA